MNLFALFLTFLFFCHPKFLAVAAIILAVILLFSTVPSWGIALLVLIVIGFLAYKLFVG